MSQMILEDKGIPAVLARSVYASEGFSANVPITAMVERNVFAEEGRNIIIPAGSRVIGRVNGGGANATNGGAVKSGIVWNRLIRPDGSQFTFNNAQTADAQGRSGAIGYLDQQLLYYYCNSNFYRSSFFFDECFSRKISFSFVNYFQSTIYQYHYYFHLFVYRY
jgi:hypothetical protein